MLSGPPPETEAFDYFTPYEGVFVCSHALCPFPKACCSGVLFYCKACARKDVQHVVVSFWHALHLVVVLCTRSIY